MTEDESATRRKTDANISEVTRPNRNPSLADVALVPAKSGIVDGIEWEFPAGTADKEQRGIPSRTTETRQCAGRIIVAKHHSRTANTTRTAIPRRGVASSFPDPLDPATQHLRMHCSRVDVELLVLLWQRVLRPLAGKAVGFRVLRGGGADWALLLLFDHPRHAHACAAAHAVRVPPECREPTRLCLFLPPKTFPSHVHGFCGLGAAARSSVCGVPYAPASIKDWKLEYYACALLTHVYNSSVTIAVRQIFQQETVHGQMRSPRSRSTSIWSSSVLFIKVYVGTSAKLFLGVFAGAYVQLASGHKITGSWNFAAYSLGSLVLKMAIKGLTRVGLTKLNVKDPRSIFVVAGLPTVLIDTQVHVTLQRSQSANYTIVWTIGMAVFEIVSRMTTVYVTRRQIRCREIAMRQAELVTSAAPSAAVVPNSNSPSDASSTRIASVAGSPAADFEKWRRQILAFQIAESYANMSAEYIAMGCSTSILFFYWNHPKYELSGHRATGNDAASASASASWSLGYTICAQIAVEVFVDFVSCALESSEGVDFQAIRKYRGFLGLLFTSIALMNIQICALIYFNDR